jgi:hypothetical protein
MAVRKTGSGSSLVDFEKHKKEESPDVAERLKETSESLLKTITYYSMPLVSVVFFISILVFGTIPSIQSIFEYTDTLEERHDEVEDLEEQIDELKELRSRESEIVSNIQLIDKIVPSEKTLVAEFVMEIREIAQQNDLKETEQASSEQLDEVNEDEEDYNKEEDTSVIKYKDTPAVIKIPTETTYTARFPNISSFLNQLYYKDDLIIIESMELEGSLAREYNEKQQQKQGIYRKPRRAELLNEGEWTLEIKFEKYQFSEGLDNLITENLVAPDRIVNEEIMSLIRKRN